MLVAVILVTSRVLPPPAKVSAPPIIACGEARLSVPPLLKVVLFASLSAPLMKSVPPPKTVVPIAELPLSRFNVPPFSTVSLVRTVGPGGAAHGGQSAVDKVAGCRTAARNSLGARNDRRAICAAADGQRAAAQHGFAGDGASVDNCGAKDLVAGCGTSSQNRLGAAAQHGFSLVTDPPAPTVALPAIWSPVADPPLETVSLALAEMLAEVSAPPLTTRDAPPSIIAAEIPPPLKTRSVLPDVSVKTPDAVEVVTDVVVPPM